MYSKIRFAHPLEWRLKLNNKLYNNYPLLEIKDFGPLKTYGEDKELKLNEKITPLPIPPPRGGRIEVHHHTDGANYLKPSVLYVILLSY